MQSSTTVHCNIIILCYVVRDLDEGPVEVGEDVDAELDREGDGEEILEGVEGPEIRSSELCSIHMTYNYIKFIQCIIYAIYNARICEMVRKYS